MRIALRELRGGFKGFRVFIGCLFLGVVAIAGVGSLAKAVLAGLQEQGQELLAGDVEVRLFQRQASAEEFEYLAAGGILSRNTRLRGMARAIASNERTLTEIKAADGLYPLYGDLLFDPPIARDRVLARIDGRWGAAIPAELADRLEAGPGDELLLGDEIFEIRAILVNEPDRSNDGIQWGPTVLIDWDALADTGMVQLGSLIHYHYRLKLPAGTDIDAWKEDLTTRFPEAGWRIRDRSGSAPGVRKFVERMGMFLTLVGLTALVVGGVGVGNAVRSYMEGKTGTIATLKILGATSAIVFRVYLIQIMLIALLAIAAGLLVGGLVPPLLAGLLSEQIPVPPSVGLYAEPLVTAAIYGFLITLAFAVWPLAKARDLPAARLFRSLVTADHSRPRARYIAVIAASAITIVAMAIFLSEMRGMAAGFAAGAIIVLLLLRFVGYLVQRGAAMLPRPRNPGLRLALANIHRPGAATAAVVLSLGLGLTLIAAVTLVQKNLTDRVEEQIPDQAPAFFMIDIQQHQIEDFIALAKGIEGVSDLRTVPTLRGRIISIAGVPVGELQPDPQARWVIDGDRGLTYAAAIPEGNSIVEGEWWDADYSGPPLISFAAREARGLGIQVGDSITLNILGREITATIANLRDLNWGTFGFNFVIIFAPGALENAPHVHMATLRVEGDAERLAHRTLTDAFPNVTAIRMKDVLNTINNLLSEINMAVRATALVTILAGILVLAGAIAAGQRARVYDAVILKVLGAVRLDVLRAYILEYIALGLLTGLVALGLGTIAGYAVVVYAMDMEFAFYPLTMGATILASVVITLFLGLIGTWSALGARPMQVLREQ
ncbi:MAG: FtsX-like permease family protein [Proteobacteria bacterium]|nr:FtsX-like permease family protein [Pseudomonadota bacterium]